MSSTDSFVLSELFSVARHVGRSKPGLKPIQLYVRLSLRPLGHQAYHIWLRELLRYLCSNSSSHLFTFLIPYRLPECSILSKSFALCERRPKITSPECSTPMGERIYCHPQTDCFVLSELFSVARQDIYMCVCVCIFSMILVISHFYTSLGYPGYNTCI